MGVTYKLKDEVIDYIVKAKQTNPKAGCRSIAQEVSEKFGVEVSKSSVNIILKNARLSNAVGRPKASTASRRKFSIPKAKKEQIFQAPPPEAKPKPAAPVKLPADSKPGARERGQDAPAMSHKASKSAEEQKPLKNKGLPLMPDPMVSGNNLDAPKELFQPVTIPSEEAKLSQDALPWAGAVLLKLAIEECFAGKPLNEWIQKYCETEDARKACDAFETLVFLMALKGDAGQILQSFTDSPWASLLGHGKNIKYKIDVLLKQSLSTNTILSYGYEKNEIFTGIETIRLNLHDNTNLLLDPHAITLWNKKVERPWGGPLNNALRLVSRQIITNAMPLILGTIKDDLPQQKLFDFISAMENVDKKSLVSVDLFDGKDRKITTFPVGFSRKRNFIAGLSPDLPLCRVWGKLQAPGERKEFRSSEMGLSFDYIERQTALLEHPLLAQAQVTFKVFSLFDKGRTDPFVYLLTNQNNDTPESTLRAYFHRFPLRSFPWNVFSNQALTERNPGNAIKTFSDLAGDLLSALKDFCFEHYFALLGSQEQKEFLWENLITMNGVVGLEGKSLIVQLNKEQKKGLPWGPLEHLSFLSARNILTDRGLKYILRAR